MNALKAASAGPALGFSSLGESGPECSHMGLGGEPSGQKTVVSGVQPGFPSLDFSESGGLVMSEGWGMTTPHPGSRVSGLAPQNQHAISPNPL